MAGTKNCWRCSGVASSLIVQLEYRPMVQHAIERTSGFGSLSELMRKFMRMGRCGSMPVMQPAGERTVHGRQQALGRTVESGGGRARKREKDAPSAMAPSARMPLSRSSQSGLKSFSLR